MSVLCMGLCVLSCFSRVQLFATLWAIAHQAPLSLEFSRQEYWYGLLCTAPGDLPDLGIKPKSLRSHALETDSLSLASPQSPIWDYLQDKRDPSRQNGPVSQLPVPSVGREGSLELSEGTHPEEHILSGVLISLQHLKIGRYHTEI